LSTLVFATSWVEITVADWLLHPPQFHNKTSNNNLE
jgi:hypothetical protein